jgi:hypothetical protein
VAGFECRPAEVARQVWYRPRPRGIEARLVERLAEVNRARSEARSKSSE